MCVPLAFSLLNRFTHNLPLEARSSLYPGHRFRRSLVGVTRLELVRLSPDMGF